MTNEELDRLAAEKIMGWELRPFRDNQDAWHEWCAGDERLMYVMAWHPTTDRNQSRQVVGAAMAKINAHQEERIRHERRGTLDQWGPMNEAMGRDTRRSWLIATPRQEVEAALMATGFMTDQPDLNMESSSSSRLAGGLPIETDK